MKAGVIYPVRINANRREIDYALRHDQHDAASDFNIQISIKCDSTNRTFGTITISSGGLMAALGNRADIEATFELEDSYTLLGMTRQHKEVWIKEQPRKQWDESPKLSAKQTDEGWMYWDGYGKKGETRNGATYYPCRLYRYVPQEIEEE